MKAKQIWIIVGVIALILIIANWNKIIFGAEKKKFGGFPQKPGVAKQKENDYCKMYQDDRCDLEVKQSYHCNRLGNLCAGQSNN